MLKPECHDQDDGDESPSTSAPGRVKPECHDQDVSDEAPSTSAPGRGQPLQCDLSELVVEKTFYALPVRTFRRCPRRRWYARNLGRVQHHRSAPILAVGLRERWWCQTCW